MAGLPKEVNMSIDYPFIKLTTIGLSLGFTIGCAEGPDSNDFGPKNTHEVTESISLADALEGSKFVLPIAPELDMTISYNKGHNNYNPFELAIDIVEFHGSIEAVDEIRTQPCEIEALQIDDLGGAHPVDILWVRNANVNYELFLQIIEPQFNSTVATISQTSLDKAQIDLAGKLTAGSDYILRIEVMNFDTDEFCLADGLTRFEPIHLS
jgi:hypothetical protein